MQRGAECGLEYLHKDFLLIGYNKQAICRENCSKRSRICKNWVDKEGASKGLFFKNQRTLEDIIILTALVLR